MEEVWRSVKDFEGIYEVSNLGRVRSLDREVPHKNLGIQRRKGKILSQKVHKGYLKVNLNKSGQKSQPFVHRLVAESFVPNPDNKIQVNHVDEDCKNNSCTNLEWCTPKENCNHGTRNERISRTLKAG